MSASRRSPRQATRTARQAPRADAVRLANEQLGDTGRVLLRPSGTEPLVRVMVEAEDHDAAERIAAELAGIVRSRLALT